MVAIDLASSAKLNAEVFGAALRLLGRISSFMEMHAIVCPTLTLEHGPAKRRSKTERTQLNIIVYEIHYRYQ